MASSQAMANDCIYDKTNRDSLTDTINMVDIEIQSMNSLNGRSDPFQPSNRFSAMFNDPDVFTKAGTKAYEYLLATQQYAVDVQYASMFTDSTLYTDWQDFVSTSTPEQIRYAAHDCPPQQLPGPEATVEETKRFLYRVLTWRKIYVLDPRIPLSESHPHAVKWAIDDCYVDSGLLRTAQSSSFFEDPFVKPGNRESQKIATEAIWKVVCQMRDDNARLAPVGLYFLHEDKALEVEEQPQGEEDQIDVERVDSMKPRLGFKSCLRRILSFSGRRSSKQSEKHIDEWLKVTHDTTKAATRNTPEDAPQPEMVQSNTNRADKEVATHSALDSSGLPSTSQSIPQDVLPLSPTWRKTTNVLRRSLSIRRKPSIVGKKTYSRIRSTIPRKPSIWRKRGDREYEGEAENRKY